MFLNSSLDTLAASTGTCFLNSSSFPYFFLCFNYTFTSTPFAVFASANLLLCLPIYLLVLKKGIQQWLGHVSPSSSNADVFIYHGIALEVIASVSMALYSFSVYTCGTAAMLLGYHIMWLTYVGQSMFHCLTCTERYMAVVHPAMYRRQAKEVLMRARKACAAAVWFFSIGFAYYTSTLLPDVPSILFFCILVVMVIIINFCSFSMLYALVRLGLWKVGGDRRQIDQSKLRAFHIVTAVTVALWFRLGGFMGCNISMSLAKASMKEQCILLFASVWLYIPSSIILPVMFLLRAGKFRCCKSTQEN